MIITNVYGGLGNQMFQYAVARSIAIENNVDFKLDISKMKSYDLRDFLLNSFNIKNDIATDKDIKIYKKITNKYFTKIEKKLSRLNLPIFNNIYYEKQEFHCDSTLFTKKNIYLEGYWQTPHYFNSIRDIIIDDFSLKVPLNNENLTLLDSIKNSNSVSLHIRRGDYVNNSHTNKVHGTCSLDYYHSAINVINEKVDNPIFFIFSDDIQWVKEKLFFDNEKIFVDINNGETCYFDMELMKNCKHNIIANSTFSWWGAWLNQHQPNITICPEKWVNINIITEDLIPKGWIRV